jgi:hypothetical protein
VSPQPPIRIGDAEREAAATALGEHYAAGRLTKQEYDERAAVVWAAKTAMDMQPVFADLPSAHRRSPAIAAGEPSRERFRPMAFPLFPLLAVIVGVALLADALWLIFVFAGLLFMFGSRCGRRRHGMHPSRR